MVSACDAAEQTTEQTTEKPDVSCLQIGPAAAATAAASRGGSAFGLSRGDPGGMGVS